MSEETQTPGEGKALMVLWCVSGCTVRGRHLVSCSDDECQGCAPRQAEVGRLCRWCFQTLTGAVVDIPGLTAHLRMLAEPHLSSPQGHEGGGGSVPGSRVLLPPELMAVDELAGLLGTWVDEVVAEHPARLRGPSDIGWRFSHPDRAQDPVTGTWYLPSDQRLGASQAAVEEMCRWLLPHLAWVAEQPWAGDMRAELCSQVATAKARWPIEERSHVVPMPCPRCGQRALVYHPPEGERSPAMVGCENAECGRLWLEDAWTRVVEMVLARPELVDEVVDGASA